MIIHTTTMDTMDIHMVSILMDIMLTHLAFMVTIVTHTAIPMVIVTMVTTVTRMVTAMATAMVILMGAGIMVGVIPDGAIAVGDITDDMR